jgi:hypothetical protein
MQVGLEHPADEEFRQLGSVQVVEQPAYRPSQGRAEDLRG